MSDATQKPVKVSQDITHALEAKSFIRESGEGDIRASGPLNAAEQELMGCLAAEAMGLIACGTGPSMVDVETLARLASRVAENWGVL